jgi:hypothetical protein
LFLSGTSSSRIDMRSRRSVIAILSGSKYFADSRWTICTLQFFSGRSASSQISDRRSALASLKRSILRRHFEQQRGQSGQLRERGDCKAESVFLVTTLIRRK